MAQIFVANIKEFDGMNKAWDAWVAPGNAPPRATIEARLANPDYKVEIVVTAALPSAPDTYSSRAASVPPIVAQASRRSSGTVLGARISCGDRKSTRMNSSH